jgi:nitroreductase/NAD-dependent dihydropyrimidine dehydrogenase PreA subunit
MVIQGINSEKCIQCNNCILDCPENLFQKDSEENKVIFSDPLGRCILCGHCLAVCPADAIRFLDAEKPFAHSLISKPDQILRPDDLLLFMRARRSIRQYQDRAVPAKILEFILSAMRFAPTASNKQSIHFTVITSKKSIAFFSKQVNKSFRAIGVLLKLLRFFIPFGRKRKGSLFSNSLYHSLRERVRMGDGGNDPIFFHAPCVIILSSPGYAHQSGVDAGIVLAHGMLAAQAKGLGTCLLGFAHEKLLLSPALRRYCQIPPRFKPRGVMALGFPTVRYTRAPMRKPLSMNKL